MAAKGTGGRGFSRAATEDSREQQGNGGSYLGCHLGDLLSLVGIHPFHHPKIKFFLPADRALSSRLWSTEVPVGDMSPLSFGLGFPGLRRGGNHGRVVGASAQQGGPDRRPEGACRSHCSCRCRRGRVVPRLQVPHLTLTAPSVLSRRRFEVTPKREPTMLESSPPPHETIRRRGLKSFHAQVLQVRRWPAHPHLRQRRRRGAQEEHKGHRPNRAWSTSTSPLRLHTARCGI
jgi:hypothetical protein